MPAKSERAKVDVKETRSPDLRTFSITLTVPTKEFQLTDLLRQRGVIEPLDSELKRAIKEATERYIQSAESLIAGLATRPILTQRSRSSLNGNGKPGTPSCAD